MARVGRPQEQLLMLSDIEREELDRLGRSQSASHSLVRRAQIILASAAGVAKTSIASRLGVSHPTICHWRKIWFKKGLTGLYGEARSGRPRTHAEERIASFLRTVLESKAGRRDTLDRAVRRGGERAFQKHGRAHACAVQRPAAPLQDLPALERSVRVRFPAAAAETLPVGETRMCKAQGLICEVLVRAHGATRRSHGPADRPCAAPIGLAPKPHAPSAARKTREGSSPAWAEPPFYD